MMPIKPVRSQAAVEARQRCTQAPQAQQVGVTAISGPSSPTTPDMFLNPVADFYIQAYGTSAKSSFPLDKKIKKLNPELRDDPYLKKVRAQLNKGVLCV